MTGLTTPNVGLIKLIKLPMVYMEVIVFFITPVTQSIDTIKMVLNLLLFSQKYTTKIRSKTYLVKNLEISYSL